jgi:hypothetical protein
MLETPLYGRFVGENRRLVFAPTGPYHALVRASVIGGFVMAVLGLAFGVGFVNLPFYPAWWLYLGLAVAGAGALGALSLRSVVFDLRERTYRRREGPGLFPATSRGSINELDAIVLIAEPNARLLMGGVTYHLVLHWKGARLHPLVLQQDTRVLPGGQPLNAGSAQLLQLGMRYAAALGLPIYDNSHFPSKNPFPILR